MARKWNVVSRREPGYIRKAHQLDGAALVVGLPNIALALQIAQVLVHGRQGGVPERVGYLFEARGVPIFFDEALNMVEDLFLSFGQGHIDDLCMMETRIRPEQMVPEGCPKCKAVRRRPWPVVFRVAE